MKIEIDIATAEEATKQSALNAQHICEDYTRRRKEAEDKGIADFPRFVNFLNEKIKTCIRHGSYDFTIDFDDEWGTGWHTGEGYCGGDSRINFTFKGSYPDKAICGLKEIFENLGYSFYYRTYCESTYREGTIQISWPRP